jgi:ribosomal protein S1|tara:strand:- start:12458 stop:13753 length:1296 start_codon:yes stop_codon:yes gene_type:complete
MNNEKNKRIRIGETKVAEVKVEEQDINVENLKKDEDSGPEGAEFYNEAGEFDWDSFEATCPSKTRKHNPHIKTQNGDRVFSREVYAQEMYDILTAHDAQLGNVVTKLNPGEIHEGKIYAVSSDYISVDIGYRELIYVKYDKEPEEVQALKPGDETAVLITLLGKNSHITGSITGGVKHKVFMDLREAVETGGTAWIGKVTHMIENGGYMVLVQGIECFMPGSLAGINKLHDFGSIIGTEMYVVPVSFSPDRGTLVVSHRKYLQAMIPSELEKLKENQGETLVGNVTGTAKYGVFVEFNQCLTGMIHNNDLDEDTLAKFKARDIKPGDEVEFIVKDIISNTKITLTQKANAVVNPWSDIISRYQLPAVVEATVKTKKDYGLFITIEEGVTGLLHVSEVGEEIMDVFQKDDKITVQITRIDVDSMKVFLKMPQ